jgi:hypothetical protein
LISCCLVPPANCLLSDGIFDRWLAERPPYPFSLERYLPNPYTGGIKDRITDCGGHPKNASLTHSLRTVGTGAPRVLTNAASKRVRQITEARQPIIHEVRVGKLSILIEQFCPVLDSVRGGSFCLHRSPRRILES